MAVLAATVLIGLVARDAMSGQNGGSSGRTTTTTAVVSTANSTGGPPTAVRASDAPLATAPGKASGIPSGSPSGSGPATDSASPAPTPVQDAVASVLPTCRREVASAELLARAADASYRDWNTHVSAQLGIDRGTLTAAQARTRWATSKVRGPSDAATFRRAWSAYRDANGGCGRLGAALTQAAAGGPVPSAADTAVARACVRRAVALAGLATGGKAVNDEWTEHVAMMARKQDTAHAAYSARWRQMVRDAVPVLASYGKAKAALTSAPACPTA